MIPITPYSKDDPDEIIEIRELVEEFNKKLRRYVGVVLVNSGKHDISVQTSRYLLRYVVWDISPRKEFPIGVNFLKQGGTKPISFLVYSIRGKPINRTKEAHLGQEWGNDINMAIEVIRGVVTNYRLKRNNKGRGSKL